MKTELHREELSAEGFRFAVASTLWHHELTSALLEGALKAFDEAGAVMSAIEVLRVPGAFELPLACLKAAESGQFDAVIALGVVIRGETPHFEYVAGQASAGIMQASMQTGVPVLFGVITADNIDQATRRAGPNGDNKGYEAALAAIEMAHLCRRMRVSPAE